VTGAGLTKVDAHHFTATATGGTITFKVFATVVGSDSNASNDFFQFGRGNVQASGTGPMGDLTLPTNFGVMGGNIFDPLDNTQFISYTYKGNGFTNGLAKISTAMVSRLGGPEC